MQAYKKREGKQQAVNNCIRNKCLYSRLLHSNYRIKHLRIHKAVHPFAVGVPCSQAATELKKAISYCTIVKLQYEGKKVIILPFLVPCCCLMKDEDVYVSDALTCRTGPTLSSLPESMLYKSCSSLIPLLFSFTSEMPGNKRNNPRLKLF